MTFDAKRPGTQWRQRLQRVLDLVDTPTRYGNAGDGLRLDATGRRFEWATGGAGGLMAAMLALPGLRGLWTMGVVTGYNVRDMSGAEMALSFGDAPQFNEDGAPYVELDGTDDYLYRADEVGLDITGTESYMAAPGLTLGGWFWFDTLPGSGNVGIMSKYNTSGDQRSYLIDTLGGTTESFVMSADGTGTTTRINGTVLSTGTWHFLAGRFTPSAEVALYHSGIWYRNTASIPASIYSGTADFEIGSFNAGGFNMDGRAAMCFLCAAAVADVTLAQLWAAGRHVFGV